MQPSTPSLHRTAFMERGRKNVKVRKRKKIQDEMVWKIMRMDDTVYVKEKAAHMIVYFVLYSLYMVLEL